MTLGSIQNSLTSINYYFDQTVKPAASTAAGETVCFYYEGNQKLTYPSVVLHHFNPGEFALPQREFCNQFEVHVFTNRDKDIQAWGIMDSIYTALGFSPNNILMIKQIDLLNWAIKSAPVKTGCIRLALNPGQGWRFVDDSDSKVRHYILDLEAYYK